MYVQFCNILYKFIATDIQLYSFICKFKATELKTGLKEYASVELRHRMNYGMVKPDSFC